MDGESFGGCLRQGYVHALGFLEILELADYASNTPTSLSASELQYIIENIPNACSNTLLLEELQQMLGPVLKVLLYDLCASRVLSNLSVGQGFSYYGIDVCDEGVLLEALAKHFRSDQTSGSCYDDLHGEQRDVKAISKSGQYLWGGQCLLSEGG